jgi:hypothetical protein
VEPARIAVAALLLVGAAAKLRVRDELPELVGAYGVPTAWRRPAGYLLVAVEAALGVLLLLDVPGAAYAAFALGVVFVGAVASVWARGRDRVRCGCFGARERPTSFVLLRSTGFAALAGLAAFGGGIDLPSPGRDDLVLVTLAVLGAAVVALALLVLALYRQVGVLSMRISPVAPLEIDEEGPPVGQTAPALSGLVRQGAELVAFFSEDCRLCRELAPSVRALAREGLAVRVVYEEQESQAYTRWNVPGAPFAVHVVDGVVAAKGLVNTLEQLDALIAVGQARRAHAAA